MEKISITRDLIEFLKEPNYNSINDLTIVDKLKILFKVFILTYVGLFIVSFPLAILELLGIIERFEMKTKRTYELINENISN